MKPAIGYVRVSDVGGRSGESYRTVEQQKRRIAELARERGYRIIRWIIEEDVSGRKVKDAGARFDRPEWDAAELAVVAGEAKAIIVYDVKRFGREAGAILATHRRLSEAGGELLIGDLPFDLKTRAGAQALGFSAIMAQAEGDEKADRFELSKRDAWEDGIYLATWAPFGYRFDERRRLVVEELEALVIVELFELRASGGSWSELVDLFEARTGRTYSRPSMKGLIERRAYLGESPIAGEFRRSPNGHAAIVSEELFNAAQRPSARWKASSTRERFDGRATRLYTGFTRCGACGSKMHATEAGSKRRDYYRCSNRSCTARANILADELDAYVTDELRKWAGDDLLDEPVELELATETMIAGRRLELVDRIAAARAELETFVVGARGVSAELLQAGIESREEDVERAVQELESFEEANVATLERATVKTTLREMAELDELTLAERRRLVAVVLDRIVVRRGRVVNSRRARLQPASELVELVFASPIVEDRAELLEDARA